MYSFFKTFANCKKEGKVGKGEFFTFDEHPEFLPAHPNKEMAEGIKNKKFTGIISLSCLRFGGVCSSKNAECRKVRELLDI